MDAAAASPLAPVDGLDAGSKKIVTKARTSNLSTSEVAHLLGQAQRWSADSQHGLAALLSTAAPVRPEGGSLFVFGADLQHRADGYAWQKKERHMLLKVNGEARVNCYYATPAHGSQSQVQRRRYWLIDHRDLVLVHYIEVQSPRRKRPQAQAAASTTTISEASQEREASEEPQPPAKRARFEETEGARCEEIEDFFQLASSSPLGSAATTGWELGPLDLDFEAASIPWGLGGGASSKFGDLGTDLGEFGACSGLGSEFGSSPDLGAFPGPDNAPEFGAVELELFGPTTSFWGPEEWPPPW